MSLQINPSQLTVDQRREGLRQMVLIHLARLGGRATAGEIEESIAHTTKRRVTVPPRLTELRELGKVRDTGLRAHTKGRPKIVWASTDATSPRNDHLFIDEPQVQPVAPSWWEGFGQ